MPFRPNYWRDRLERDRATRARTDEKQRNRDEKSAKRKAERTEAEGPPEDTQAQHAGGSSAKSVPTNRLSVGTTIWLPATGSEADGCEKMLDRKPDCRYRDSLRPRWSPERGS